MTKPLMYKWNLRFNDGSTVYVTTKERFYQGRVVGVTAIAPNLLSQGAVTGRVYTKVDPEDDCYHHDAIMALCKKIGWTPMVPELDMLPMDYIP